jgi:hypothetical protein
MPALRHRPRLATTSTWRGMALALRRIRRRNRGPRSLQLAWGRGRAGIRPANWGLRPNSVRIILQRIGGPLQGLVDPQVEGRGGMAEMLKARWGCWHPAGWRTAYQDEVETASAVVAAVEGGALAGPASGGVAGRLAGRLGRSRLLRFTTVAVMAVPWQAQLA